MNTEQLHNIQSIIHFMKSQCGIDLQLSSTQSLLGIESRMQVHDCLSYRDYFQRLQSHDDELQALIEEVVVPETWFFRYPESFDCLTKWMPKTHGAPLDILSIPCSTGEEPYSIVMNLLMEGLPHQRFHVDAADISSVALQRAEAAVYYEHSFRHHDLRFRERYFDGLFDTRIQRPYWKLHPHVQQCVSFHQANILQPNSNLKQSYDVIFCRNLLIYFDKETQVKVLKRLHDMLKPNGLLFVGHSGSGHAYLTQAFTLLNHRGFVWQKGVKKQSVSIPSIRAAHVASVPRQAFSKRKAPASLQKNNTVSEPLPTLASIESLANQGKLLEAAKQCEQYTSQYPSQAQGWYLLGVIMQAENCFNVAKQHFQKTLYLNPNHEHGLLQLAIIAEHEGQHEQAERLRQRLKLSDEHKGIHHE